MNSEQKQKNQNIQFTPGAIFCRITLLNKEAVFFEKEFFEKNVACFVVLGTILSTMVSFGALVQAEGRIETRSKHNINVVGEGWTPSVNLSSYANKHGIAATSGRTGIFFGPRGIYMVRDYGVGSYSGTYGGSYWELFNRNGQWLGTYDKWGNYLRP